MVNGVDLWVFFFTGL